MSLLFLLIVFIFGLAMGSFFNVCIYRIPRNESLIFPPSHCPNCKKRIKAYDNIPVLSYILLFGKCRFCKKPISIRYPLVELLTGLLFAATVFKFGYSITLLRAIIFISFLIIVGFIDLEHLIAPFRLTIPGLLVGLITAFLLPGFALSSFIGMFAGGLFVFLAWLLWRYLLRYLLGIKQKEGIGWGDLPLTAMIGAFLGWQYLLVALFASIFLGAIIGLVVRAVKKGKPGEPVPFGPFLALGSLISLFFGQSIINLYLNLLLA
jgi:leader peptidase (prepilin peptidase) / N-methyltransferase